MDTFINTFGGVAALCFGVIILACFFTVLGYVKSGFNGQKVIKMKGFLKDSALIKVHLTGGKSLERMKFVGFTDSSVKGNIPYQLSHMVVLENEQGLRTLLRADAIKMIEETATGACEAKP